MEFLIAGIITFVASFVVVPIILGFARGFGLYTTVDECTTKVYVCFGKVLGTLTDPGLHIPVLKFGPNALLVPFFGRIHTLDMRLDQRYLRSQAVNTDEGTPMGIGVWYEMRISDPVAYLFENTDPVGSLLANVTNATVRNLSNMPLEMMLVNRHEMSRLVREEVSPKSQNWGYRLGSVYIRKVHFRDRNMIEQIEQKVVNRLRQVTSAIRQAGANQVDVITSAADRDAAKEFARAQAMRPQIVGDALTTIAQDPRTLATLFEILETEKLIHSKAEITLIPEGADGKLLGQLMAAK